MRKRNVHVQFWLDKKEAEAFNKKVKRSGLSREVYLRHLINGLVPQDAPPPAYFSRVGADLVSHFAALGSKCVELDASERLRILHDFYRQGEEAEFQFNAREMAKRGHDFKDYICPNSMEKNSDYVKLGDKFCRVLFLNKLLEQPEEKAKEIALSLELYTTGSLDIFGRDSTVDLSKPYVVFDIHGLGEQLKPAGSLVITDTILNRVTLNWKRGKRTHVFIDEFHVMFENEQSGIFFNSAWRQFRKRGAYPTAITQNVEYLLDSVQASTMLSNSEFIVMLNQAASDREKLSKLLNISKEQMSYVTNADAGCGLIRYGSALVPFVNRFPRNTKLYALMTTKPGEGVFGGEEVLV